MRRIAASLALLAFALWACVATAQAQLEFSPAAPGLPFSPAVRVGDILYLSGQIGTDRANTLPAGIAAQGRQALDNIAAVLKAHGATMNDVFKCTVMLADMKQWADFNKVYVTYFDPKRLPARSAFGANGLAAGALLEIECWAYMPRR